MATCHIQYRCASLFEPPISFKMIYLGKQTFNDKILPKNQTKFTFKRPNWKVSETVSYTHLTLPTTPYV